MLYIPTNKFLYNYEFDLRNLHTMYTTSFESTNVKLLSETSLSYQTTSWSGKGHETTWWVSGEIKGNQGLTISHEGYERLG